jgi:hypothetical protein
MSYRHKGWEITGGDNYDNTDGQLDAYNDGFEKGYDYCLKALRKQKHSYVLTQLSPGVVGVTVVGLPTKGTLVFIPDDEQDKCTVLPREKQYPPVFKEL